MLRRYVTPDEAAFALRACADAIEKFDEDDLSFPMIAERVYDFVRATVKDYDDEEEEND